MSKCESCVYTRIECSYPHEVGSTLDVVECGTYEPKIKKEGVKV